MEIEEARVIFNSISRCDKQGIGVITLSNETGIPQSTLRKYLLNHIAFFAKVGNSAKYTINRFSKYKGSVESMLIDLEKENKDSAWDSALPAFLDAYKQYWSSLPKEVKHIIVILVVILITLLSINNAFKLGWLIGYNL